MSATATRHACPKCDGQGGWKDGHVEADNWKDGTFRAVECDACEGRGWRPQAEGVHPRIFTPPGTHFWWVTMGADGPIQATRVKVADYPYEGFGGLQVSVDNCRTGARHLVPAAQLFTASSLSEILK